MNGGSGVGMGGVHQDVFLGNAQFPRDGLGHLIPNGLAEAQIISRIEQKGVFPIANGNASEHNIVPNGAAFAVFRAGIAAQHRAHAGIEDPSGKACGKALGKGGHSQFGRYRLLRGKGDLVGGRQKRGGAGEQRREHRKAKTEKNEPFDGDPSFFSFIQFSVSQRKCQEKKRAVGQNAEALFVKIQLV